MAVTKHKPQFESRWDSILLQNPHTVADKRLRVQRMFTAIAPSYDLNNRLHSMWMDQRWRSKAVKLANLKPRDRVVDVACGTGDLSFKFAAKLATGDEPRVLGIDFTYAMLPIAVGKAEHGQVNNCRFLSGDAQALPLPDSCCDVVSIAFGIRNVQNPATAVAEFFRVLRPGGRLIILEFSLPTNRLLRGLYNFYFHHILPTTATLISGDKTGAYKYLPQSVNTFISRDRMIGMMQKAGFVDAAQFPMTFGICVCYRGIKPGGV
jgi:demethylmenaquinone methyltransferase/2-methoxy-6-polyprenyl-1,4-benzoquinol methylase